MIKSIIFDWDGTILNTLPFWLEAYKLSLKNYNKSPMDSEIIEYAFGDYYGHRRFGIEDDLAFIKLISDNVEKMLLSAVLHDHVELTLENLHNRGYSLVLFTSSPKKFIERDLARFGLVSYFSKVITAEDVEQKKPNPEGILKIFKDFGLHHTEVMIVGDSDKDINAGKAALVKTVLYYPEVNKKIYPKKLVENWNPDHVIDSFIDLNSLLEKYK